MGDQKLQPSHVCLLSCVGRASAPKAFGRGVDPRRGAERKHPNKNNARRSLVLPETPHLIRNG